MRPHSIDRARDLLTRWIVAEQRRGWAPVAVLAVVGVAFVGALALDVAGAGSSRFSAVAVAIVSISAALALAVRRLEQGGGGRRLVDLLARPDLIVWIYEDAAAGRGEPYIYVCSRRGERLRVPVPATRCDQALELLVRIAPAAPRGYSPKRDAAFERDPLSVTSA